VKWCGILSLPEVRASEVEEDGGAVMSEGSGKPLALALMAWMRPLKVSVAALVARWTNQLTRPVNFAFRVLAVRAMGSNEQVSASVSHFSKGSVARVA
jgi:hypothetical protein